VYIVKKKDKKLTTNDQMKNGSLSFQSRYESWRSICDKFFITRQKAPLWFVIIALQWHDACSYKPSIWIVNFQFSVLNWHAGLNAILNKTIPISPRTKVFFYFIEDEWTLHYNMKIIYFINTWLWNLIPIKFVN